MSNNEYIFDVSRTETRTLSIPVTAGNLEEAEAKALEEAANRDYSNAGNGGDVDYEAFLTKGPTVAEPLAKAQHYLNTGGNCCPACGSSELDSGSVQTDGLSAWREVECEACGASWEDVYKLTGIGEASGFDPHAPVSFD